MCIYCYSVTEIFVEQKLEEVANCKSHQNNGQFLCFNPLLFVSVCLGQIPFDSSYEASLNQLKDKGQFLPRNRLFMV